MEKFNEEKGLLSIAERVYNLKGVFNVREEFVKVIFFPKECLTKLLKMPSLQKAKL